MENKNIVIIGLGLLGVSLGMALNGKGYRRLGWTRNPDVRAWAVAENIVDETADDISEIIGQADITVICLPIPRIMEYLKKYAKDWKPGSVVTDIGSVKEVIVNCGEQALAPYGVNFVGSHPMAGTEKTGPEAAFPELYNSAEVFVTITAQTSPDAVEQVTAMWKSIGTSVVELGLQAHDMLVAHTSHISHILALSLTEAVLDCDEADLKLRFSGCATGFRDTSRITSSSPSMWREIIENNQPAVLATVKEFEKRWLKLIDIIENKDYDKLETEFAHGKKLRDSWIDYKNSKHNCKW
ncbi:MAG: prephenate dehydrogenase/arogenate dehydrogenase family protein [Victivallaceae bacterium]|nr:prephenate dehydrogenase/arogenate dehydrogenase family protein [Victivallaceae bacterium]